MVIIKLAISILKIMLSNIIKFSLKNKFIVLLFTVFVIGYGIYALTQIPIGAVPDVTNNQVQVITTSQNLSTQDMEQFITCKYIT